MPFLLVFLTFIFSSAGYSQPTCDEIYDMHKQELTRSDRVIYQIFKRSIKDEKLDSDKPIEQLIFHIKSKKILLAKGAGLLVVIPATYSATLLIPETSPYLSFAFANISGILFYKMILPFVGPPISKFGKKIFEITQDSKIKLDIKADKETENYLEEFWPRINVAHGENSQWSRNDIYAFLKKTLPDISDVYTAIERGDLDYAAIQFATVLVDMRQLFPEIPTNEIFVKRNIRGKLGWNDYYELLHDRVVSRLAVLDRDYENYPDKIKYYDELMHNFLKSNDMGKIGN